MCKSCFTTLCMRPSQGFDLGFQVYKVLKDISKGRTGSQVLAAQDLTNDWERPQYNLDLLATRRFEIFQLVIDPPFHFVNLRRDIYYY